MRGVEIPRPNSATASGSPAATSEPNTTSSTIAAAISPVVSGPGPPCAFWIGGPPSPISRASPLRSSAISISRSPVSSGTSEPGRSSCRRLTAIVPSSDTCGGAARLIPSSCPASAMKSFICSRIAGERAPASASHTTSTVSEETPSKRSATSSRASRESEPGTA